MAKKLFSLIIVPHSKESFKSITLSKKTIKFLIGSGIFAIVILVGFLVDYSTMNVTRLKYKNLRSENAQQKKLIADYENSVKKLQTTITNFESYAKKLNIMGGLKSPEVMKEIGVGGGSSENAEEPPSEPSGQGVTLSNIQNLISKAEGIEQNLNTLVSFFESRAVQLASTPTIWPTIGWQTSAFGWRDDPFTGKKSFHYGIDIATNFGNPIVASADGIIVSLGNDKIAGRNIIISHAGGYSTVYMHMSQFLVKAGQKVKRGDVIGLVGKTGKAIGPHLHYEVRINDKAVNPYNYILEEE